MLSLLEVIKSNKRFKRKDWPNYIDVNNIEINLFREDIIARDWQFEGQIWKEMTEFKIKYYIDNFGNIYSNRSEKVLTPKITRAGYHSVTMRLKTPNQVKGFFVHVLVAKYFLGHVPGKLVVNHIDGIKINNDLNNLEVVTRSRNSQHAYDTGLNRHVYGESCYNSVLTVFDVVEIKRLIKEKKLTQKEIGKLFNVSPQHISKINCGDLWSHV